MNESIDICSFTTSFFATNTVAFVDCFVAASFRNVYSLQVKADQCRAWAACECKLGMLEVSVFSWDLKINKNAVRNNGVSMGCCMDRLLAFTIQLGRLIEY